MILNRADRIIKILINARRPLSVGDIAAHFPEDNYHTIAIFLYRMEKKGQCVKGKSGGYMVKQDYGERMTDDIKSCGLLASDSDNYNDLAALWKAGFDAGRFL